LGCYLGCVVVLTLLTMAKRAANLNYALEFPLVLSPLFAAQLQASITRPARASLYTCLLAVTLLLGNLFPVWAPTQEAFASDRALQAYLRENFAPGTPALGHYAGDLVRARLDTPISDLYQYSWLACRDAVSNEILLAPLRSRHYALILLRFDLEAEKSNAEPAGLCVPKDFYSAVTQNYRPVTGPAARLFAARHYYAWVPGE